MNETRIKATLLLLLNIALWIFLWIGYQQEIPPKWFFIAGTTFQTILAIPMLLRLISGKTFFSGKKENIQ